MGLGSLSSYEVPPTSYLSDIDSQPSAPGPVAPAWLPAPSPCPCPIITTILYLILGMSAGSTLVIGYVSKGGLFSDFTLLPCGFVNADKERIRLQYVPC